MQITNLGSNINTITKENFENIKSDVFKQKLESALKSKDDLQLKNSCEQFEAYFINRLFKSMRQTINYQDDFIKRSDAEVTFQEMLDDENSKKLAKSGGIGLADMMYTQLKSNSQN